MRNGNPTAEWRSPIRNIASCQCRNYLKAVQFPQQLYQCNFGHQQLILLYNLHFRPFAPLWILLEMAQQTQLPEVSHYITSFDPTREDTFLEAPNPPLVQQSNESMRVDYIYSTVGSATGPVLTDLADYKNNQAVRSTHPHVMFSLAGGSAVVIATVSFCLLYFSLLSLLQLSDPYFLELCYLKHDTDILASSRRIRIMRKGICTEQILSTMSSLSMGSLN